MSTMSTKSTVSTRIYAEYSASTVFVDNVDILDKVDKFTFNQKVFGCHKVGIVIDFISKIIFFLYIICSKKMFFKISTCNKIQNYKYD